LLDARPPVAPLVTDATPETVAHHELTGEELAADEHRLREVFGLLVDSHYRTTPADLHRLLDAPNLSVHALTHDGHVVAVALLAAEGGLAADRRAALYEGGTIMGHLVPDLLTSQLRDEAAGEPTGLRVVRIATHAACRNRGLGSELLSAIRDATAVDWLGVAFGATPRLISFWAANGFGTVALSTTRNAESGEYSAVMLAPCSAAGRTLHDRQAAWFAERVGGLLSGPIDDCDPDVVRAALAATDADPPLDLSPAAWRTVASMAYGPGLFDVAPHAFRAVALAALVDDALDADQQRLLVRKALQSWDWDATAADLDLPSTRVCRRTLARAYRPLVDRYGDQTARETRTRFD
jgi:tRNA(Met) cytidine acetyltransferase